MKSRHALYTVAILITTACNNSDRSLANLSIRPAELAQMDTGSYTTISWKDTLVNFGTANEGDTVHASFAFVNSGNKPLFISDVKTSCGCTIADYPTELVTPGGSAVIKAVFATDWHPGPQRKMVMVRANTKGHTGHKLIFTGEVIPKKKPAN